MIIPKTCRLLQTGKTYLGSKSYVFGFLHTQDAIILKEYISALHVLPFIQEKPKLSGYYILPSRNKKKQKKEHTTIRAFESILDCAFYLEVNNVDLVLIDHVQIQKDKAVLYSNYAFDLIVDNAVKKDQLQRVFNGGKIDYSDIIDSFNIMHDSVDDDDFMNYY